MNYLINNNNKKQILRTIYDNIKQGMSYFITFEEDAKGSEHQNRAFHSLLGEYWASGCSSYESYEHMKNEIKLRIKKPEYYVYSEGRGVYLVKLFKDIPDGAQFKGIAYSWSTFLKKQRTETIDMLKNEMINAGVNSVKFDEIIKGMEG